MIRFNQYALLGVSLTLAVLVTTPCAAKSEEENKKAENLVRQRFPVLGTQGMPPLAPVSEPKVTGAFPRQSFFVLGIRQYPVARLPPEPLKVRNLFAVTKDDRVQHLTDIKGLEKFFRTSLGPVTDTKSAKDSVEAWLRLSQEFKQDGFFKFSIPEELLAADNSKGEWQASGKALVTAGGRGEIRANLTFTAEGKLAKVEEKNTVKAGVRPICQATKLLDPDPVVRQMAEKDILVMGRAAKEYLDEQRAKASPELRQAIGRVWQRIVEEGW
jgi:hypothetical protein